VKKLRGTPASPGAAIAPAWLFALSALEIPDEPPSDLDKEVAVLRDAAGAVADDLDTRAEKADGELSEILGAQAMMARDPEVLEGAERAIRAEKKPAARAVIDAGETYAQVLQQSESEYMAARAADVRDVCLRIARRATGAPDNPLETLNRRSVVVADDLPPADVSALDPKLVAAIATAQGSRTSHTAIVARALGIPAVVGIRGLEVEADADVALDGDRGEVIVDPDADVRAAVEERATERARRTEDLLDRASRLPSPTATKDGRRIEIAANVASELELRAALEQGAEAVGLFRTELFYLDRAAPPTRAEQAAVVRAMLDLLGDRRLVVRTFDFGADKPVGFLDLPGEVNPALGVRGIRLAQQNPDLLDEQIGAVQDAAAAGGNVAIMAPMVSTAEEARWFRERVKADVEVGVMVEVPSAVFVAQELADICDFLSVGTNDLCQYLHAADRLDGRLGAFQDPFSPALLRAVKQVCDAARGRAWVGVCGEAAGDPLWARVALGLGATELSMGADAILEVRVAVGETSLEACRAAAHAALGAEDAAGARRAAEQELR
jgi:phosphoenolpyruvate-protein phosphotransferase (PTS system enzyme I)